MGDIGDDSLPQPKPIGDISEPLRTLFETKRRPDGTKHSLRSVADFVARDTGMRCSHVTLSNYLKGREPRIGVVVGIANAFQVSIQEVCGLPTPESAEKAVGLGQGELAEILTGLSSLSDDERRLVVDTINALARTRHGDPPAETAV